eukprot:5019401-Amphidinium_carterae.1
MAQFRVQAIAPSVSLTMGSTGLRQHYLTSVCLQSSEKAEVRLCHMQQNTNAMRTKCLRKSPRSGIGDLG